MFVVNGDLYRYRKDGAEMKLMQESFHSRLKVSIAMQSRYFNGER